MPEGEGYALHIDEVESYDSSTLADLGALDLLTYSEPTFSRYTLAAFLRHGKVYTIRADDVLVGACHCMRNFAHPDEVILFNMALRPGWRGQGLGTRFLVGVLERMRADGARAVRLLVSTSNARAIAVYQQKFGFALVARLEDPYGVGQAYLEMLLDLQEARDPALDVPGAQDGPPRAAK
jgi:ribosomal-protein-alanine N-acetyltransferase